MANYRLTKTQQNEILQALEAVGLDPMTFDWRATQNQAGHQIHELWHNASASFIRFDYSLGGPYGEPGWWITTRPGEGAPQETEGYRPGSDIPATITSDWARRLKREVEAPDLWSQLKAGARALVSPMDPQEGAFDPEEQARLAERIEKVRQIILEQHARTAEEREIVNRELGAMKDALGKLERGQWQRLALGVLVRVSFALADGHLFARALSWLFGGDALIAP